MSKEDLSPVELVEQRVVLTENDSIAMKNRKQNLVDLLHELEYFNSEERKEIYRILDYRSQLAGRAFAKLFRL